MIQGMRHTGRCWLAVLALMSMAASGHAQETTPEPPENTVLVIGTAPVGGKNVAAAKAKALENGMRAAVDQAALGYSGAEALAGGFDAYNGLVLGKPDDYVDQYQILAESTAGDYCRLLMRVTVSAEKLFGKLPGPVIADPSQAPLIPKVLFLLAEQGMEDLTPRFWWGQGEERGIGTAEAAMMAVAKRAGFEVMDHGTETPDIPVKGAIVFQVDLTDRDALEVGRHMGAGLAVVGKAIVYKVTDTAGEQMPMFNATLTARLLHVGSGEVLASVLETGVAQHWEDKEGGHEALQTAGTQAMERLLAAVAGKLTPAGEKTDAFTLHVSGTDNLGNFVQFRKQLAATPGVESLRMTGLQPNAATIEARFAGAPEAFVSALKEMAFKMFTVEIESVEDRAVRLSLNGAR